jgi:hypothetical protein
MTDGFRDSRFGIRDSGFGIRDSRFGKSGFDSRLRFHVTNHRVGVGEAPLPDEPSRRFWQPRQQQGDDESWHAAEEEHDLPPENGHEKGSDLTRHHQADREDQLVQQKEPATPARPRELVDVRGRDRHLAAHPDALHEAQGQ